MNETRGVFCYLPTLLLLKLGSRRIGRLQGKVVVVSFLFFGRGCRDSFSPPKILKLEGLEIREKWCCFSMSLGWLRMEENV